MCIVEVSFVVVAQDLVRLLDIFEPDRGVFALFFWDFVRVVCKGGLLVSWPDKWAGLTLR